MYLKRSIILIFGVLFFFIHCKNSDDDPVVEEVNIPVGNAHELLSEYNFFKGNVANLEANTEAGVLPYDLNMALFSDYALKKRFVYVPEGSQIAFDTSAVLDLPVGSVLIKHFYYAEPNGVDNYVETRLLIRRADGWKPETYEWNETQTDAQRTVVGGTRSLTATINGQPQTFNYLIPNQNQCTNCHAFEGDINPIGPTVQNLNKDYNYADGTSNQLDKWKANGILSNSTITSIPKWPKIDDLDVSLNDRARAYLAVNCASCHRLEGSAANSGLYLEYTNRDSLSIGFWKTPIAAGSGSGGFTYVIHPGMADESILLYRMIADEVDERMPEIGRELLHNEGIALIREWIDTM